MVAKNSILVVGRFQKKKIFGKYYKKNLRQYIAYNTATVNHSPLAGDLQVFFVGYYTVKLIGSVVYCLNIFRPKLSCENVLACHMPDKHMPGEFLPAFFLTNLFPPLPEAINFLLCQHKRIHVHSVWRLFFQSMHHKLHTNKNKKDFIKSYPFCDHEEKKKTVTNSLI